MRIAVVGAQNVGKTTFIKDFLERYPKYFSPKVSYRDVIEKRGLKVNQETSEESQQAIQDAIYESTKSTEGENIIFDRCLIDNLAYSRCAEIKGKVSKEFVEESKVRTFEHFKYLDVIVFVPVSLGVELAPGINRDLDKDFVDLVNKVFIEIVLEVCKKTDLKIVVLSGGREERVGELAKKLDL